MSLYNPVKYVVHSNLGPKLIPTVHQGTSDKSHDFHFYTHSHRMRMRPSYFDLFLFNHTFRLKTYISSSILTAKPKTMGLYLK